MAEWKEVKLGDVVQLIGGGTPKTSVSEYWNGNIPWLSVKDFNNDLRYVYSTEKTITELGLNNSSTKLLEKNDIIISARGTVGELAMIPFPMAFNQSCYGIRAKNISDSDFLYYLLKANIFILKKNTHGSVFDTITTETLLNLPISLPPLPTQKKIAEVLSCLDAKIELNRRINENLEQQAQAIFKEWFVDNAKPEWKVGKLCEIADVIMGQSPDGKSYNEEGNGKIFFQGRAEFGDRFPTIRLYTTEPKRIASQNSVLLSVRAPVGDINVALEECCIGRGLASITAKGDYQSFVLYTMKNAKTALDVYNGEGTIFGCVNKDALNNLDVIIPPMEEIMKFEEVAKPIDEKVKANTIESRLLVQIRDTLLPKLMSGELEV